MGGGPRVVVSTAAFHASVRGSVPGLGGWKKQKMCLPHPRVKVGIVGSLRDREVACSTSDRQGSYFESCVWRTVSSQSSHHPQEVLLTQFSIYVHKSGLKPDSLHFYTCYVINEASIISCVKLSLTPSDWYFPICRFSQSHTTWRSLVSVQQQLTMREAQLLICYFISVLIIIYVNIFVLSVGYIILNILNCRIE